jgi:hypothetical protein
MSLILRPQHWEWAITLKQILDPFNTATQNLSGRKWKNQSNVY